MKGGAGDELEDLLAEIKAGRGAALYLLMGEEFLVRRAADELVKALVPDASAGLNLFVLDGASPREVAQELATLPLFPGAKVALIRDPEFIAPKKGRGDALGRARDAWKANRRKEGARRVLALAARAGWGVAQLDASSPGAPGAESWREELNVELAEADLAFLKEVAQFCREEGISAPESDVGTLVETFEKGLPKGHALVIAASEVDARNPLVKFAKENGRVLERKVAAKLKDVDLKELAADVLAPFKKRLGVGAEAKLKDRCGGNMRLIQSELEKLALYCEGPVIEAMDVEAIVGRVREEEFLELSDALQKRDLAAALVYLNDALGNGSHGLQLLGAVASIVRSLLEARDRVDRLAKGVAPRSYDSFKSAIFPAVEREIREVKGEKARMPHPYAAFLASQAAGRYGRGDLIESLRQCAEADLSLKSGGSSRLVLERLLWTVCGAVPSGSANG